MKTLALLVGTAMIAGLASPAFARVEAYGRRNYTRVGHFGGPRGGVVIDRDRGPGWGSAIVGGILGAAAGLALGGAIAGPPVVVGPAPLGSVVAALPGACGAVPTYNGAALYDCGGIFYQPVYEGYSLMYQVVPAP